MLNQGLIPTADCRHASYARCLVSTQILWLLILAVPVASIA